MGRLFGQWYITPQYSVQADIEDSEVVFSHQSRLSSLYPDDAMDFNFNLCIAVLSFRGTIQTLKGVVGRALSDQTVG
jgi:hypothetical protein